MKAPFFFASFFFGLLYSWSAFSMSLFIEPGVFVNMMNGAEAVYDDGSDEYHGAMRNGDLSYAIKLGLHSGRYEFGVESEVYNLIGHFEGKGGERDFAKEAQITYNSLFIGYEFVPDQFLYLAVSSFPYMSSGGESYIEKSNLLSLEYSNHLKNWVSLNIKFETASELRNEGSPEKEFHFKNLLLVGFSFPLSGR